MFGHQISMVLFVVLSGTSGFPKRDGVIITTYFWRLNFTFDVYVTQLQMDVKFGIQTPEVKVCLGNDFQTRWPLMTRNIGITR